MNIRRKALLRWVEVISICGLAIFLTVSLVGALLWIAFGVGEKQGSRLKEIISVMDEHWKVLSLVLLPMFYRAMMSILSRLREIGPAKIDAKKRSVAAHANPQPTAGTET